MIPWLVALAIVLLYLGYLLGVAHGESLGERERETLRDGLDAALRRAAELPPFEGPPEAVYHEVAGDLWISFRRPMGTPRRAS
jgi:hypothetical protein